MSKTRNRSAQIASLDDALYLARKRVPKGILQRFVTPAGAGITARRNNDAFDEIGFLPRGAEGRPGPSTATTVLGHPMDLPVYLSPVGGLRGGHVQGELAATRAAGKAGTIQWVSGITTTPIEEIAAQATGPVFQQLYFVDGKSEMTAAAIERCRAAGVAGLVLIADSATYGASELPIKQRAYAPTSITVRDVLKFAPQLVTKPEWAWDFLRDGLEEPRAAMACDASGAPLPFDQATAAHFRAPTSWADLPWIRERWDGPIVMKGLVSVESARRAVDEGMDAIVVSNHGGRTLDGTIATMEALPRIVDAVGDQLEVLVDGGIRRGSDVVKALALGARAVGIGRGYLYPLLAAGEDGVDQMLRIFRNQIE
ncbi:MAG: alpha-hydroxy-acid oxidizing protein, partial [Actinomycetota bacterium]|nr:alpha-hydroxy-acid oxidizing protein [Actinomycetota bacterium]